MATENCDLLFLRKCNVTCTRSSQLCTLVQERMCCSGAQLDAGPNPAIEQTYMTPLNMHQGRHMWVEAEPSSGAFRTKVVSHTDASGCAMNTVRLEAIRLALLVQLHLHGLICCWLVNRCDLKQTDAYRCRVILQIQPQILPPATDGPGQQDPPAATRTREKVSTAMNFTDLLCMCVAVQCHWIHAPRTACHVRDLQLSFHFHCCEW